jgi:hypothetical protein
MNRNNKNGISGNNNEKNILIAGNANLINNGSVVIENQIPYQIILELVQLVNRLIDEQKELRAQVNCIALEDRQQFILPNSFKKKLQ